MNTECLYSRRPTRASRTAPLHILVFFAALVAGAVNASAGSKANTTVALVTSANPSCAGQSVGITATVSVVAPGTGTPTGSVTFQDGATSLATVTLSSGAATFTTSTLSVGSHSITAVYTGNGSFNPSTSAALTETVTGPPDATISAATAVCANSVNNVASVADAGAGAGYGWTISGGTITSGAGTPSIAYTVGSGSSITLTANVTNSIGCWAKGTASAVVPVPNRTIAGWRTIAPQQWQESTFNKGDAFYSEGAAVPLRFTLLNTCPGGSWSIDILYDFQGAKTAQHFFDFLTTYNATEQTELGSECAGHVCSGSPTTFPIPSDPGLAYQLPGVFTVYNGAITGASAVLTTNSSGSTIQKQITLTGVTAPGASAQDVLILVGGHFAGEIQWGPGNGASSWSGASGKASLQFSGESSPTSLSINPSDIVQLSDLSAATMSATAGPVCAGSTINYSLVFTNAGPNQAQSVTVTDNLPPGLSLVSATMSQGSVAGTTNLTFSLGNINATSNASISMVVSVNPGAPAGTVLNTAIVSAITPTDPNTNNNSVSASTVIYARTTASPMADQLGCLGTPTTFSTVASGTGPFTYQWTKNGANINGATSSAFTIPSVSSNDGGTYCVVVTGTCNSATSCATLTVSTNAATSPLVSLAKCPGDTVVFSTTPSGTGPFTITWKKNGVIIPGQTGTTLTLANVSSSDAGVYCVDVAGYCNATNNCATLTINTPLQLTGSPTNQSVCPGSNVTFSVTATGSSLAYQWFKGTQPLSGQTASSLTLTNVSATDADSYSVVVSSPCGSSVTNTASLDVPLATLTAPAAVTISCTNSLDPSVDLALGVATVADTCGTLTPTFSDQIMAGNCAGNFTVQRTWSVQDPGGDVFTALQIITVQNTTTPSISAPADVVLECPADTSPANTGTATAQDGCSTVTITYSDSVSNTSGGANVISRLWTATDGCGNSANALQTITVQDTTPPTLSAPASLTLPFTADTSTNSTGAATAQDACSTATVTYSDAISYPGNRSELITRTWVATDAAGNSANAIQTISLGPVLAPVLPPQSDITTTDLSTLTVTNTATDPNGSSSGLTYQLVNPPAGMTIDNNGIITWTPGLDPSPSTNIVTTVVTITVTNSTGSVTVSSSNSFIVIVTGPSDGLDMMIDSDGDGQTNLVEVAVGGDPLNPTDGNNDIIIYITQDSGNHYLAMKYKARINAAALQLQYLPEVSADKVAWFSDTNHVLGLGVEPADSVFNWVTVRDTTPIIPTEARFIRLHVIWGTNESFSLIWIGTDTLLRGNNLTMFSQRMVRPILSAGIISALTDTALSDTNAAYASGEFGTSGIPSYVDLDAGGMLDISSTSPQTLGLASSITGFASVGDRYRIRAHFTVASLLGTNNETGLVSGPNPAEADNVLIYMPETQTTLTVFYYSNPLSTFHGWLRADTFSPAADLVVYPEEGLMVLRIVPSDAHMYLCGPIKLGVGLAPVQPGYNLLGTLKSLSSVRLADLNLITGDTTTGMVPGLNPTDADDLIVVQPDGTVTTYFYYQRAGGFSGWLNANGFSVADDVLVPPGSAFLILRQAVNGFLWTIPAE